MRCYFMRNGHIVSAEALTVESDAEAIRRAQALFRAREGVHGFEVWDRMRRVHCYPSDEAPGRRAANNQPTSK
jgi:pentatricopeptide repeat protein